MVDKHEHQIKKDVEAKNPEECEECAKEGNRDWVALRMCMTCGHVGCCDSSQGHARTHFEETGHPIITQNPGNKEGWNWCYPCDDYIK